MNMLEINHLIKSYRNNIVLNIERLQIPKGQSFGLVGNNGAGKTTLFRIILDLIKLNEGEVLLNGVNVSQTEDWKQIIGSFIDEKFLIDYLRPEEYFNFLGKVYGLNKTDLNNFLNEFEDIFNDEVLGYQKYIRDLSKGNKKKLGIAAALIGNPEVVLLDEPFENLDPSSQIKLKKILSKYTQDNQVTFLISSHDLNHVTEICNRIVILEKGKVYMDENVSSETRDKLTAYFSA